MGWAKYAEDNFEIYLERMDAIRSDTARQQLTKAVPHFFEEDHKKSGRFSQGLTEKSGCSLH